MKKIILAALAASAASCFAQGGLSIGAKVGTLGPGLEMSGYLTETLNIRVGGQYLRFGFDTEVDNIDYEVEMRFASLLTTLDWHPNGSNFRISAGFALNDNRLDVDGRAQESEEVGGHVYTPEQIGTLSGDATFDEFAPYVGIGFGNAVADDVDLSFSFDLGLVFQGTPDVKLRSDGTAAGNPVFAADLQDEEDDLQDDADKFKVYPVLSFGISYCFW
jgi:hypothetical protein